MFVSKAFTLYLLCELTSASFTYLQNTQAFLLDSLSRTQLRITDTCPKDVVSCTKNKVDSCCSPANGNLVLALQWDAAMGPENSFTIHGLWPNKCDNSRTPNNGCDRSRALVSVADIILNLNVTTYDTMKTYWPSNQGNDDKFWTHEWNKHGTCVSTLEPKCYDSKTFKKGQDVADYFTNVVELASNYNIYDALQSHDIVPTDLVNGKPKTLYSPEQFKEAIKSKFGVYPSVHCVGQRLNEVRLYFVVKGQNSYILSTPKGRDTCRKIAYNKKKVL